MTRRAAALSDYCRQVRAIDLDQVERKQFPRNENRVCREICKRPAFVIRQMPENAVFKRSRSQNLGIYRTAIRGSRVLELGRANPYISPQVGVASQAAASGPFSLRRDKPPQLEPTHLQGGAEMFGSLTNFESLFDELRRMEQGMDEIFGRWAAPAGIRSVSRGTFPATNVGATANTVDVYLFAPGLDPKGFDVSVQQNLLLVSGERRLPVEEKATYYRQERFGGEFRRVITLPEDVDANRVEAKYRDGILQISMPRKEAARPRQIQVQ